MEQKITQELIEQAKKAESAEALLALAKENGVELSAEDARKFYDMWHTTAELSDEELDNVAGGCGKEKEKKICPKCKNKTLSYGYYISTGCWPWEHCDTCGYGSIG